MTDQTDTMLPPPPAQPAVHIINVTTAQVVSAAVQNIVFGLCVTYGWVNGKVPTEMALLALCALAGIDFAGRKTLPGGAATALGIGATGALGLLSRWPVLGAAAVGAATLLSGCALLPSGPQAREVGQVIGQVRAAYAETEGARSRLEAVYPVLCLGNHPPVPAQECAGIRQLLDQSALASQSAESTLALLALAAQKLSK